MRVCVTASRVQRAQVFSNTSLALEFVRADVGDDGSVMTALAGVFGVVNAVRCTKATKATEPLRAAAFGRPALVPTSSQRDRYRPGAALARVCVRGSFSLSIAILFIQGDRCTASSSAQGQRMRHLCDLFRWVRAGVASFSVSHIR